MIRLRIPARIHRDTSTDLKRPHAFAAERVGFLYARPDAYGPKASLLVAVRYWPVPDEEYVSDAEVGAKISSSAIRQAMQLSLSGNFAAFHVHEHHWPGTPEFSRVDDRESAKLMPCFGSVAPEVPHGALILGPDGITGKVWFRDIKDAVPLSRISVVGFPFSLFLK